MRCSDFCWKSRFKLWFQVSTEQHSAFGRWMWKQTPHVRQHSEGRTSKWRNVKAKQIWGGDGLEVCRVTSGLAAGVCLLYRRGSDGHRGRTKSWKRATCNSSNTVEMHGSHMFVWRAVSGKMHRSHTASSSSSSSLMISKTSTHLPPSFLHCLLLTAQEPRFHQWMNAVHSRVSPCPVWPGHVKSIHVRVRLLYIIMWERVTAAYLPVSEIYPGPRARYWKQNVIRTRVGGIWWSFYDLTGNPKARKQRTIIVLMPLSQGIYFVILRLQSLFSCYNGVIWINILPFCFMTPYKRPPVWVVAFLAPSDSSFGCSFKLTAVCRPVLHNKRAVM